MSVPIKDLEKLAAKNAIELAVEELGLNINELSSVLGVHRRTVYRYRNSEVAPSPDTREQLGKLRQLSQLLKEVFINREDQLSWLYSSVPMLQGQLPIDMIRKGKFDEIISVLAGIQSGAFV